MNLTIPKSIFPNSSWITIKDIPKARLEVWKSQLAVTSIHPGLARLHKLESQDIDDHLKYAAIIDKLRMEIEPIVNSSTKPFVYLFADQAGTVIDFICTEEIRHHLEKINLRVGTSMILSEAGINAVSLSMLLEEKVYLHGSDHSLNLFQDWSCLCAPIRIDEQIIGYIDFSFSADEACNHCMLWLSWVVNLLQKNDENTDSRNERSFKPYNLSPREEEIACLWLENRGVLYISSTLHITEGTIRNVIKKFYRKLGVTDKGDFFKKFL